jgi:hypothetical protein
MVNVKLADTRLHSYADVYLALLDAFDNDEDKAKKVMGPLVDLSVDIALRRMQEKASE